MLQYAIPKQTKLECALVYPIGIYFRSLLTIQSYIQINLYNEARILYHHSGTIFQLSCRQCAIDRRHRLA